MGKTLEEKYIHYVRNAIDITVGESGYPVPARMLTDTGIASRKKLRLLERQGHIKTIDVPLMNSSKTGYGTVMKAYYTDRVIPHYVKMRTGGASVDHT